MNANGMTEYRISSYEVEDQSGTRIRLEGTLHTQTVEAIDAETAVEDYLAQGDYERGGEERIVVVEVDGEFFGDYTATKIRAMQAH